MDYYTHIESKYFKFRKLNEDDFDIWTGFFENNPSLPFLGIDLEPEASEKAKSWIEIQLERYKNNLYGHLAIIDKESSVFIGQAGILPREIDGEKEFEIGFSILQKYWGKGYASEVSQELRDYAFKENIHHRLISIIHIDNIASQKVATKNGMKPSPKKVYSGMDVNIYTLSRKEWLAMK